MARSYIVTVLERRTRQRHKVGPFTGDTDEHSRALADAWGLYHQTQSKMASIYWVEALIEPGPMPVEVLAPPEPEPEPVEQPDVESGGPRTLEHLDSELEQSVARVAQSQPATAGPVIPQEDV